MSLLDIILGIPTMLTMDDIEAQRVITAKADAERGDPTAQFQYGRALIDGRFVRKDVATGYSWVRKAAQQRHIEAQVMLGRWFAFGSIGCVQDSTLATEVLLAAVNDHAGSADKQTKAKVHDAILLLGYIYARGDGPAEHSELIKTLLHSDTASVVGPYYLGCIYISERSRTPSCETKAATSFALMIENDIQNTERLSGLAPVRVQAGYVDESGVSLDFETCSRIVFSEAKNGNADAQFALGLIFLYGWRGVASNAINAREMFESAASLGHHRARSAILSIVRETYDSVADKPLTSQTPDFSREAVAELASQAESGNVLSLATVHALAEAGDPNAQFKLGYMYHTGNGIAKDVGEAEIWYIRAARQGHQLAQINLRSISLFYRHESGPEW